MFQLNVISACFQFFNQELGLSVSVFMLFLELDGQIEESHLSSNLTRLRGKESTKVFSQSSP